MPETQPLLDHIQEMQNLATLAESVVNAIIASLAHPTRSELAYTLAVEAHSVLKDLGDGLDSVNLPKVAA